MGTRPLHRRCRKCRKVVRLNGKEPTGLIYSRAAPPGGDGVVREVLCNDCYDIARGNIPRSLKGEARLNFQWDAYVIERNRRNE